MPMAATTLNRVATFPWLHCKANSTTPASTCLTLVHHQVCARNLPTPESTQSRRPFFEGSYQSFCSSRVLTTIAHPQSSREVSHVRAIANVEERVDAVASEEQKKTLIKVCGVTCPEDAVVAAEAGADLIGMIMWSGSKRYVTVEQAAQISAAARKHGAEPVAVFVDGTAAEIIDACTAADISIAQLHGDEARAALEELPPKLKVVYVLHAEADGTIRTPLPASSDAKASNSTALESNLVRARLPVESGATILDPQPKILEGEVRKRLSDPGADSEDNARSGIDRMHAEASGAEARSETGGNESRDSASRGAEVTSSRAATVEWLLVDGVSAGSGETYDWTNLRLPQGLSKRGWLLAGGLDPTNVAAALGAAQPDGVDVASGVAGLDKIRKDKARVEAFIQAVKLVAISTT
ncbi:phosphoribosylanthranilate isomerase [Klebsormidium nitens]|uniref:phosphoribosylanthranilate isomerase n=1 Tax=Klebsormidium nitens TaxID=105231 RepID=A0A1Y1IA78_KLENI|nr:phosphoribosylanthranilate isomerase [Klebsormidium nitens]|eukprot:GAQ86031.1 phosphoribosylanthranilate isomerase [Klebsormidium nitens]